MRLSRKAGASYRHPTDAAFQIDFLTPLHRGGERPFEHPQLGVVLQPLRFLEYILEDVAESAIISHLGAALVNLPAPARYAIHKLIVAGERVGGASSAKRGKDLDQARELITHLREIRPDTVVAAWRAAVDSGPGWAKRARAGLAALDARAPDLGIRAWLDRRAARPTPGGRGGKRPQTKPAR